MTRTRFCCPHSGGGEDFVVHSQTRAHGRDAFSFNSGHTPEPGCEAELAVEICAVLSKLWKKLFHTANHVPAW